jgi:hypothetical protein
MGAIAADIFYHFMYHPYMKWEGCFFCREYGRPAEGPEGRPAGKPHKGINAILGGIGSGKSLKDTYAASLMGLSSVSFYESFGQYLRANKHPSRPLDNGKTL